MNTFTENQESIVGESIPFRLAGRQNPLILLPVHVNDKGPYEFILDTGASHSLLSPELAETLGVKPEIEQQAMGAGGSVKLGLAHVASITVGTTRQSNIQVAITDELKRIGKAIQSRVDGDLGFDFLKDFRLVIDYRASTLSFLPRLEGDNDSRLSTSTPFILAAAQKPLILVHAIVNDQGPFQFALDTGASRTMLSSELAEGLAIEIVEDSPGLGVGGQIKVLGGKLSSLAVGAAVVHEHAVGVGEFLTTLSAAIGTKLDGIIGYNFLNQFRVTVDYPNKILDLASA